MTQPALAHRLDGAGRSRKRFVVPDQRIGIALSDAGPRLLGPGDHSLPNWPWSAPEVILVQAGPLALDLQWDGLPSGDGEPVMALATGSVRVADPLRLHADWLRTSAGPEWGLPADLVAGALRLRLEGLTVEYAAADLNRPAVRERLADELRGPLTAALGRFGLALAAPALEIRCLSQADRAAALTAARAARELAQDHRLEEAFDHLADRDIFFDRIRAWEARTGEKLDDETIAALWREAAPDGLPLPKSDALEAAQSVLEQRAEAIEAAVQVEPLPAPQQFAQFSASLEAPMTPLPDAPSERLDMLYRGLRLVAAVAGSGWALYVLLSGGLDGRSVAVAVLEALGFLVASVGLGAAWVTTGQARQQAAPYWAALQARAAGYPAALGLEATRLRNRRLIYAADGLILLSLLASVIVLLGGREPRWLAIPAVLFALAAGLVLVARSREHQTRREAQTLLTQATTGVSLPARRTADDLLRRRMREYLGRGQTNLEDAGKVLFRAGPAGQEVSVALRRLRTGALTACQAEVQDVQYRDTRYFASVWAPDDQVAQMLELDNDLLRRTQKLALDSEALYCSGRDGDIATCDRWAAGLDKDVNQLRRVLGERAAFIGETV